MNQHVTARMDTLINDVEKLHSAPQIACRVLSCLQDEEFDVHEVADLLKADPALAGSILKLVNSSVFGFTQHVASLNQAIGILGSRSLKLAVLSFGLARELNHDGPALVYRDYWKRALTIAVGATHLNQQGVRPDEAYCAGLLADIGVLVFSQAATQLYVDAYRQFGHTPELVNWERANFGFTHGELGARLLTRWHLPRYFTQTVAGHDQEEATRTSNLSRVIYAADLLADAMWVPKSARFAEARRHLQNEYQVDLDHFIECAVTCKDRIRDSAELFQIEMNEQIDCDLVLKQAHQLYMDESMNAAIDWDSVACLSDFEPLNPNTNWDGL